MFIIVTEPCGCTPWGRHKDNCPMKIWEREIKRKIKRLLKEFEQSLKGLRI